MGQKTQKLSPITHSGHRRMARKSRSDAFPPVFAQAYWGTICTVSRHGEWLSFESCCVEAQANCGRKQQSCSGAHAKAKSPVRKGRCLFACLAHRNKLFYFNWEINDQNMVFDVILAIFWEPRSERCSFYNSEVPSYTDSVLTCFLAWFVDHTL